MKKLTLTFAIVALLGLVALPLAIPHCGQSGLHIGWSPSSECPTGSQSMALQHLSEMSSMQLGILVVLFLAIAVVVFLIGKAYDVLTSLGSPQSTVRTNTQGVNSYYYLMKPFDKLLFLLTKLQKKHFVAL